MRFREDLAWRLTARGTPLKVRSQLDIPGHITVLCRFIRDQGWPPSDPSHRLPHPRKPQRLPKAIVDTAEVEILLAQPDLQTLRGYRDRVILEVLCSTAIRREELAKLLLDDVDLCTGYLFVRDGKGSKDPVVPRGGSACDWLRSCRRGVRPEWPGLQAGAASDRHIFLNRLGQGMTPTAVGAIVRRDGTRAALDKPVSTHVLRHACATHMLPNGAPIRLLQEMLDHARLDTTQR